MAYPQATIETSKGTITVELWDDVAPKHVKNMLDLGADGFYDGLGFHRILDNFVIQGGCPNTKEGANGTPGTGGPGYNVDAEFNDSQARRRRSLDGAFRRPQQRGESVLHLPEPRRLSASRQREYTAFGKVIDGMDVVEAIAERRQGRQRLPDRRHAPHDRWHQGRRERLTHQPFDRAIRSTDAHEPPLRMPAHSKGRSSFCGGVSGQRVRRSSLVSSTSGDHHVGDPTIGSGDARILRWERGRDVMRVMTGGVVGLPAAASSISTSAVLAMVSAPSTANPNAQYCPSSRAVPSRREAEEELAPRTVGVIGPSHRDDAEVVRRAWNSPSEDPSPRCPRRYRWDHHPGSRIDGRCDRSGRRGGTWCRRRTRSRRDDGNSTRCWARLRGRGRRGSLPHRSRPARPDRGRSETRSGPAARLDPSPARVFIFSSSATSSSHLGDRASCRRTR